MLISHADSSLPDPEKEAAYLEDVRSGPDALARRAGATWSTDGQAISVAAAKVASLVEWFDLHGYVTRKELTGGAPGSMGMLTHVHAPTEELAAWLVEDAAGGARLARGWETSGQIAVGGSRRSGESPFERLVEHLGLSLEEGARLARAEQVRVETERKEREATFLAAVRRGPDELARRIGAISRDGAEILVPEEGMAHLREWLGVHGYRLGTKERTTGGATLSDGSHYPGSTRSDTFVYLPDGSTAASFGHREGGAVLWLPFHWSDRDTSAFERLAEHLGLPPAVRQRMAREERSRQEEQRLAAERAAAEEHARRVAEITARRRASHQCENCGGALSSLARLVRRHRHSGCTEFEE